MGSVHAKTGMRKAQGLPMAADNRKESSGLLLGHAFLFIPVLFGSLPPCLGIQVYDGARA
jgi:hypothetical protein